MQSFLSLHIVAIKHSFHAKDEKLWKLEQLSTDVMQNEQNINQTQKDRMYISNNKYRLAELTEENLPESARLLADIFSTQNKVWNTIKPDEDKVRRFMLQKTKEMLDWQNQLRENGRIAKETFLNFVYLDQKDHIVGVSTNFQLMQYFEKKSNVFLHQFNILQNYGVELQKSINPKDKVNGLSIYSMFTAIQSKLMGSGTAIQFWFDLSHYLHSQGFRLLYGRSSNIKSFTLITKLGGESTALLKAAEGGKQITLSFIKWYLDPIHYGRHIVQKSTKKARL